MESEPTPPAEADITLGEYAARLVDASLAAPQYPAHVLAPGLDGEALLVAGTVPPEDAVLHQIAHHAARAWAYLLATQPGRPEWPEGTMFLILEYRAAMTLYLLEVDEDGARTPSSVAVEVETDLASARVLPPNIVQMLAYVGLDPNMIAPYDKPPAAERPETPLDVTTRLLASSTAVFVETRGPAGVYDRVVELVAEYRKHGGR